MKATADEVVWEFRRSLIPLFVPAGWAFQRGVLFLEGLPWRALGIGIPISVVLYHLAPTILTQPDEGLVAFVGFAFTSLLAARELLNRRDVLLHTEVIRQRGLFVTRKQRIPLPTITRVEFAHPLGEAWDIGDVYVAFDGGSIRIAGVSKPAQGAQRILDAKARLELGSAP